MAEAVTVADHVVEPAEMRRVLGQFATGVTIVTGSDDGEPVGFACQSFTSVSLDPPLVLFCPAHTSSTWPRIRSGRAFSVNVLADDQLDVCKAFATSGGDKFDGVIWHQTPWGPSIEGVLATVHCDIEAVHPAGDHDVVVGRVRQLVTHREAAPLLFFRGQFGLDA
ncbi:MAG TPA: flavin reductase family protein [Mycobacteriales bacterium]|nr:flavin reductase family protein [Mycobacteriales bacterium]